MASQPIRVGISHGDINGIAYEVIVKALADERMCELCTPVLFGSARLAAQTKKDLGEEEFRYVTVDSAAEIQPGRVNIVDLFDHDLRPEPGKATPEAGEAAIRSLTTACDALENGEIDVLVTAPINKSTVQSDEFRFPGHTEFLEERFGGEDSDAEALMILYSGDLRVALATTHLPIGEITGALDSGLIAGKLRLLNSSLKRDFRISRPRIAVLSLNPHCGDNGLLGSEESEIIVPSMKIAQEEGIDAFGPFAADGFFASGRYRMFDGVLAMYHDQGLAPFKALAGPTGVNFTAGLPIVRTSPDHGTGYDIAGRNEADPESMREAIYGAIDIFRHREEFDRPRRNPLRKQYVERGADKTIDLSKEPDSE